LSDVTCVEFRNGSTSNHVGKIVSSYRPFPTLSLVDSLRDLHEQYVDAVNRAVAEERDDLVERLAADYTDEATALMGRVLPLAA
jgi:hypothetical protein